MVEISISIQIKEPLLLYGAFKGTGFHDDGRGFLQAMLLPQE
jgi:hypothetical protein